MLVFNGKPLPIFKTVYGKEDIRRAIEGEI